jgi:branched-chain amino acid transport system permease protein
VAVAAVRAPSRVLSPTGFIARAAVASIIALVVLLLPTVLGEPWPFRIAKAAIFAVIGLSINVITGHAGQISLGHQAFVGIGAFMSAYVTTKTSLSLYIALPIAGLTGGVLAMVLGVVALRVRGLYLALITLAFGLVAENTIFGIREFTGGGAGAQALRPAELDKDPAFAYLCFAVLAFFLFVDWRLVKSKAGRAIVSVRNDERVAATLGINVIGYKLYAFVIGGFVAGAAGSLFAHWNTFAQAQDYEFTKALVWIVMAVVGGLGSRAGVVIGSAFFAIFDSLMPQAAKEVPSFLHFLVGEQILLPVLTPLLGALLLLVTVTRYPGGIAQQITPFRRWLAGGPFIVRKHGAAATEVTALAGDQLPEEIGEEIAKEEEAADSRSGVHTKGDS